MQITNVNTTSTVTALHQLPAPPADFVGREEDLDFLRAALRQKKAIFCLRGMGGVGKTALALKLAEELTPDYPDAQFYLDLKGVDPQPLTAAQAMTHVIRSFHPKEQLPEDQAQLAALYRSVLHDKRTLLLMDNASPSGREQGEPLIPPSGSLLLVTSRFHFTLPGLFARDLDEMPIEDARLLLQEIAPRIGENADPIARLCGCLPLALRLAGSSLAERPTLSPADYIRRLSEGKDRLDGVDASLRASYDLLENEQGKLWRYLGVFPDTFDLAAASTVGGLDKDSAQKTLEDLVRYSLVEWDSNDGRYRLHDLARQFADGLLEESERNTAGVRHARHYLGILARADDFFETGDEQILTGLRLFDTEWANIQVGQAWAAKHSAGSEEAADLCSRYPDRGAFILEMRLHPHERITWREAALKASRRLGNRSQEGLHLGNLGIAYAALGESRRAIELFEQGLDIAREIRDRHREASELGNLGIAYKNLGDFPRAIALYHQALAINRESGNQRGEANVLGNLGIAYAASREPRRAIEFFERNLAITHEIGDRRGEASTLGNLGLIYMAVGQSLRAIELFEQHLAISREIGDLRGESNASWNLSLLYESEGELNRAADLMQISVDLGREIGHPDAEKRAARVEAIRARLREQSS